MIAPPPLRALPARAAWLRLLLALLLACLGARAANAAIDLRATACLIPGDRAAPRADPGAPCLPESEGARGGWQWFRLDARRVAALGTDWRLFVTQVRFDRIALVTRDKAGRTMRADYAPGTLAAIWAPGNQLGFHVPVAGRDLADLTIGFRTLDHPALVRNITAADAGEAARWQADWALLIGFFAGAMVCAFVYNLFISTGERYSFQRWYLLWVVISFCYGMIWTNMAAPLLPWLTGPLAVRIDYVLVGLLVLIGTRLYLSLIEEGALPPLVRSVSRAVALAGGVLGVVAVLPLPVPLMLRDDLLNYAIMAGALIAVAGTVFAAAAGSRTIWFYTLGWWPVLIVSVLRVIRNMGGLPQTPALDMALFAAMAFEAVILSLALADRVRLLRRELLAAHEARELARVEQDTLRRAAHTDFLTGLGNRAAFQAAMETNLGLRLSGFTLILLDVDNLKQINDGLGHAAGDALLRACAQRLRTIVDDVGHASVAAMRLGGDEFAVVVRDGQGRGTQVLGMLAAMQGAIWRHGDTGHSLSFCTGAAHFPTEAQTLDMLYQRADAALYAAKRRVRAGGRTHAPRIDAAWSAPRLTGDARG